MSLKSQDSASLAHVFALRPPSGQVAPAEPSRGPLVRGVLWGLLFAAPVWMALVVLALWLLRAQG